MIQKKELTKRFEYLWKHRVEQLKDIFYEVQSVYDEIPDSSKKEKGLASNILGYCYWRFSDYSKALTFSLNALRIFKELKDLKLEADALNNLGAVYMFQKRHQKRLACNLKCLSIRKELGDKESISGSENNIGETYVELNMLLEAKQWFKKSISTSENSTWAYFNLGKIAIGDKDFEEAIDYLNRALSIAELDNDKVLIAEIYLELSTVNYNQKEFEKAAEFAQKTLLIANEIQNKEYAQRGYFKLFLVAEKQNDFKKALAYHKKHHQFYNELFNEAKDKEIKDLLYREEIKKISEENSIIEKKSKELSVANRKIALQRDLIKIKNTNFTDSIDYAKRIQNALLTSEGFFTHSFKDSFLFFQPKDIVSGDFYWGVKVQNKIIIAVVDCTGHGVPGAFMSLIGMNLLNKIIEQLGIIQPDLILNRLSIEISHLLKNNKQRGIKDGMDLSIVSIDAATKKIQIAGAYNPVFIIRNKSLFTFKADRILIGSGAGKSYSSQEFNLESDDIIYLFTDGYIDQKGGERNKKFYFEPFRKLLLSISHLPLVEQQLVLKETITTWQGNLNQIDDMLILGVKV